MFKLTNIGRIDRQLKELSKMENTLAGFDPNADINNQSVLQLMAFDEAEKLKRGIKRDAFLSGIKNPLEQTTVASNSLQNYNSSANNNSMQNMSQNTGQFPSEAAEAAARMSEGKPHPEAVQADLRFRDSHHGYEKPFPETQVPPANPINRLSPSGLTASDNLRGHLKKMEGFGAEVYDDGSGNWTGGYGRKNNQLDETWFPTMPVSRKSAGRMLDKDIAEAERTVKRMVGNLPLSQNEYDALVDLAFNVGATELNATNSPDLNAAIKTGNYTGQNGISSNLLYTKTNGKVSQGLENRSKSRKNMFDQGYYGRRY